MGTWGTGLYSGDFAMDLRGTIGAVARLPFEGDRLVEILCQTEPSAAKDPNDEDIGTFWLVLADQFAKRGIFCRHARDKALAIIDAGSDTAMLAKLGMETSDIARRRRTLAELRQRLTAASPAAKPRPVLKKPQKYLFEAGEVFAYPTSRGQCINSYFPSKDKMPGWQADGWAAAVILERGRAFDFLAWYRPLTISMALPEKPDVAGLRSQALWVLKRPGTSTALHIKRLELETIGNLPIDAAKFARAFPSIPSGTSYAVGDISMTNQLSVGPQIPAALMPVPGGPVSFSHGRPYPTIASLDEILAV